MARNLLFKLANDEVNLKPFTKWLLHYSQDSYELNNLECTQQDFLTYFLNFVHEEIQWSNTIEENLKSSISKHEKENKTDNVNKRNYARLNIVKSPSCSLDFDKSSERALDKSIESNLTTPKTSKICSDSSSNSNYFSPVSPLYQNQNNFSTPKNKTTSGYRTNDRISPLCLSDFIVPKKSSTKKKKQNVPIKFVEETSKRIKPTFVDKETNHSFQNTTNSFSNFNTKEEDVESHGDNRNYIVEERLKILSKQHSGEYLFSLSKKLNSSSSIHNEIEIDINLISYEKQLTNLAKIYPFVLNNYLVLNVNSEVYFLISILLNNKLKCSEENLNASEVSLQNDFILLSNNEHIECSNFFTNAHNTIYFVVKCLELSINLLRQYDKTTLWLLSENNRIKTFSINLSEKLKRLSNQQSERILELLESGDQINVCFNLDTDNRDNFPNEFSFHSFRKQRDLFYEILRIWEYNHSLPGWSFSISLGGKIRSLLSLQTDPTNFIYFCRLFKDQLLSTYGKILKEGDVSELNTSFLSSLPNIDATKLNRLKSRLITKDSPINYNSLPLFTGYQEFYKEFILIAANYIFNCYLCDIFISEIVELNETNFLSVDFEESDETNEVHLQTKKAFVACLQHLRILAKFLGFIETLPYKSDVNIYPDKVLSAHIQIRQQITPSLDVRQMLLESIKRNTVVQIIPWLTEYLSMLDTVTLRLPYYISVHKILFRLYRVFEIPLKHYNTLLIKSSLGWLFELPHFPDSGFFHFYTSELNTEEYSHWKYENNSLDTLGIVDLNILYTFCPYLEEIKKLLMTNTLNNKITAKYITPVTAVHSNEQMNEKKIQQQLEEAFLNGQPGSVRKTIEFVSERIASACVKHLCYVVVSDYKKKALIELKSYLNDYKKDRQTFNESFELTLKQKVSEMIPIHISCLKQECGKEVSKLLKERLPPALENLLALDTLPQTKAVCVSISVKICKARIKQWIDSHITMSFLTKEFVAETSKFITHDNANNTKRKPIFALPSMGNGKGHKKDSLSAAHALDKIRCFGIDIIEKPTEITVSAFLTMLQDSRVTLSERCDVNENINSSICTLLVDTSLLLCAHRPDILLNDHCTTLLVEVCRLYYGDVEDLFKRLLCPRNVQIMSQAHNVDVAWDNFANFVAFLIKENMLSSSAFESQCTEFYRRDWDENYLKNMAYFLNQFVEYNKKNGGSPDQFLFLLEFVSNFCRDL